MVTILINKQTLLKLTTVLGVGTIGVVATTGVVTAAPLSPAQAVSAQPANQNQPDQAAANTNSAEAAAKDWIVYHESRGSYTAQNGRYYGKYQLDLAYLGGDLSPAHQDEVADQYVATRYGSWTAAQQFWMANGWY